MAAPVQDIALVGASGNFGGIIVDYFLSQKDSPFNLTVVRREGSEVKYSNGVKEVQTDYSPTSLENIFTGQDAVVVCLPPESSVNHKIIIDAAVKAGVKRFVPGEFGVRTYHEAFDGVLIAEKKRTFIRHLQKTEDKMGWTALINNAWIDFCVTDGLLGFDIPKREAIIYNGGDVPYSSCNRIQTARALYALLSKPAAFDEARNQFVHFCSYTTTQNELLSILERLSGQKWNVKNVLSEEVLPKAFDEMQRGLHWGLGHHVQAVLFAKGDGPGVADFRPLDNWQEKLDLPKDTLEDDMKDMWSEKWPIVRFVSDKLPDFKLDT